MRTRNGSSTINHISNDYSNDQHSSKRVLSTPTTTTTTAATATSIYEHIDDKDDNNTGSNTSQDKPISNEHSGNDYDNYHYNDDNKHPIGLRQFE